MLDFLGSLGGGILSSLFGGGGGGGGGFVNISQSQSSAQININSGQLDAKTVAIVAGAGLMGLVVVMLFRK